MANEEDIKRLREGVKAWNEWRRRNPKHKPDLSRSNLYSANLSKANLENTNLSYANASNANLHKAALSGADLSETNLYCSNLSQADLSGTNLSGANMSISNLSGANLSMANMAGASLYRANLTDADLTNADISNINISNAIFANAIITGIRPENNIETLESLGALNLDLIILRRTSENTNSSPLQIITTRSPLLRIEKTLFSTFTHLPPTEQRRNDFNLTETLEQSPDIDIVLPEATSFASALEALLDDQPPEHIPALRAAITKAVAEDYAIIGIRNPPADLGPDLLNGGFSVGSVVKLLEKGVRARTITAAIFLVGAGVVVVHLSAGVGRGLERGTEEIVYAICERIADDIRRPMTEAAQIQGGATSP